MSLGESLRAADATLRARPATRTPWALAVVCGLGYGAAMGLHGGIAGDRAWQVAYSAIKVPLLLASTVALGLPSFAVIATLSGVRNDLGAAVRAVIGSQVALALILTSLAPLTLLWNASSSAYHPAILFNGVMFAAASLGSQVVLRRLYRPLLARDPRHRWPLRAWGVLYGFAGIQMGWVLRPFLGSPEMPVRFFRDSLGENAYVFVVKMIWEQVGR